MKVANSPNADLRLTHEVCLFSALSDQGRIEAGYRLFKQKELRPRRSVNYEKRFATHNVTP